MPRLLDTLLVARSTGSAIRLCFCASLGCCLCALENLDALRENIKEKDQCSSMLQITLGVAGLAAGIWSDVLITPEFYDAMVDFLKENTEAAELSISAFAWVSNAVADILLPFAGYNAGNWSARLLSYGIEKCKDRFFTTPQQLSVQDVESPTTEVCPFITHSR